MANLGEFGGTAKQRKAILKMVEVLEQEISNRDEIYLITWNPNPRKLRQHQIGNLVNLTSVMDYQRQWVDMIKVLKVIRRCSNLFCIIPEVSDNGKLHCHGWFKMSDKTKWLKSVCGTLKNHGFILVSKMKSKKALEEYYKKDIKQTTMLIENEYIVISNETINPILEKIKKGERQDLDMEDVFIPTAGINSLLLI